MSLFTPLLFSAELCIRITTFNWHLLDDGGGDDLFITKQAASILALCAETENLEMDLEIKANFRCNGTVVPSRFVESA